MNIYHCYGMAIRSDLLVPELSAVETELPEAVTIRRGAASPEDLPTMQRLGPYLEAGPNSMLLSVPDVAQYLVEDGRSIRYEPHPVDGDDDSIRLFLLGSCLGALLMQRGHLVLHGNAFEVKDGCVICVGDAGVGKSTVAAAMMQRGYRILADDVCPIDAEGRALPGMPRIKLWRDSAAMLGIDTEALPRVRPRLEKFSYPLDGAHCDSARPVRAIYVLGSHQSDAYEREAIEGFDKFTALKANTYRFRYLEGMGGKDKHMAQCAKLAPRIAMARLIRPGKTEAVGGFADLLEQDMRERGLI